MYTPKKCESKDLIAPPAPKRHRTYGVYELDKIRPLILPIEFIVLSSDDEEKDKTLVVEEKTLAVEEKTLAMEDTIEAEDKAEVTVFVEEKTLTMEDTIEAEEKAEVTVFVDDKTEEDKTENFPIRWGYCAINPADVARERNEENLTMWWSLFSPDSQPRTPEEFTYVELMRRLIECRLMAINLSLQ